MASEVESALRQFLNAARNRIWRIAILDAVLRGSWWSGAILFTFGLVHAFVSPLDPVWCTLLALLPAAGMGLHAVALQRPDLEAAAWQVDRRLACMELLSSALEQIKTHAAQRQAGGVLVLRQARNALPQWRTAVREHFRWRPAGQIAGPFALLFFAALLFLSPGKSTPVRQVAMGAAPTPDGYPATAKPAAERPDPLQQRLSRLREQHAGGRDQGGERPPGPSVAGAEMPAQPAPDGEGVTTQTRKGGKPGPPVAAGDPATTSGAPAGSASGTNPAGAGKAGPAPARQRPETARIAAVLRDIDLRDDGAGRSGRRPAAFDAMPAPVDQPKISAGPPAPAERAYRAYALDLPLAVRRYAANYFRLTGAEP